MPAGRAEYKTAMRSHALVLALVTFPAAAPAQAAFWQTDFAAARKAAAEQGRPLLLLFRCER
jgi:hypothetical protein